MSDGCTTNQSSGYAVIGKKLLHDNKPGRVGL